MSRYQNLTLIVIAASLFAGSCISWSHVQYMELTIGTILLVFNHQSIGQFLARCFAWLRSHHAQKKQTEND
jgi:uncharacterized membrane protein